MQGCKLFFKTCQILCQENIKILLTFTKPVRVQILHLQFTISEAFWQFQMSFCILSKNCKSLKSDTSRIFEVIHWTSYIVSYFRAIKNPLLNNNMISQRFIVHINFKLHTSFFSNYHFVTVYQFWLYLHSVNFCLHSPFFKLQYYVLSLDRDFDNLKKQKGVSYFQAFLQTFFIFLSVLFFYIWRDLLLNNSMSDFQMNFSFISIPPLFP